MRAIQQWFLVLSEREKTAALFTLLRNLNIGQKQFFIKVLQEMSSKELVGLGLSSRKPGSDPRLKGTSIFFYKKKYNEYSKLNSY